MRAWDAPALVSLPGSAPLPRIFDTAANTVVQLEEPKKAGLYVCGITPYDATHMGHASTYVAFDLLNRAWRDAGVEVTYVQNVTDVDDPLLERATATNVDWQELAEDQTELFRTDMAALNVLPPDHYVGVVESIDWLFPVVEGLLERGLAYRVPGFTDEKGMQHPDGDIYLDVKATQALPANEEGYSWAPGQVSHMSREEMLSIFAERGGDPDRPGKRDALDPLLWRAAREGEPSWEAGALGAGRPGWHIECTMIARRFVNGPLTVQAGGSDLTFPHHDLGAGHSWAVDHRPHARHYAHTGMVGLDGHKMSKSRGNLVLVSKLRAAGVDPNAIRLAILNNHYRSDWFWTDDLLHKADARLETYRHAIAAATGNDTEGAVKTLDKVREYLADDLNAPEALKALDAWAIDALTRAQTTSTGAAAPVGGAELIRDILAARLGVTL